MSNQVAIQEAQTPATVMRSTLERMSGEFKNALPAQIPVDKFIRITLTAIQMNPRLLDGDRRSLLGSCMKAAQDGLLCDGREAQLVMYGDTVQYMPMVGGILKKMRNSGEIASISANVVYSGDSFEYELGDFERINHKPLLADDRGDLIAVYCIVKTKDGAIYREVMSKSDVEKVRAASKAKNSGPWTQWYDEMAKKTVIKRIAKRLPSSADVDAIIAHDNDAIGFEQRPSVDVTPVKPALEQAAEPTALLGAVDAETGKVPQ